MSELNNLRDNGHDLKRQLLVTVSAVALLTAVYAASEAQAADQDADRPTIWIELGGSFSKLDDTSQIFDPAFVSVYAPNGLKSPLVVQKAPRYGFDEEAKISFQPNDSDWVFAAGFRYGRSAANRNQHQQFANAGDPVVMKTTILGHGTYYTFYPTAHVKFADAKADQSETHAIVDFEIGKDVGIGAFGRNGSSAISAGVRIAQFISKSDVSMNGQPDLQYPTAPITDFAAKYSFKNSRIRFHNFSALANNRESFKGLGPKLAWNASASVSGNEADGEIALDWGANIAVLFGRQKASGSHQTAVQSYYLTKWNRGFGGLDTKGRFKNVQAGRFLNENFCTAPVNGPCQGFLNILPTNQHTYTHPHNRSRMVAVPNLGGFAGISFRYRDAKVSFGYRADEFFGVMDGGIDKRKSEKRGFFGPYASVSVGLGGSD